MLQRCIIYLFIVICSSSCGSDEPEIENACNLIDCATVSLRLEFVAAATGEDLFSNNTFDISSLQMINIQTNEAVNFYAETFGSGDRTVIVLPSFVENSTLENYQIFIPDLFDMAFRFSVEVDSDPCCLLNSYSNVAVEADDITIENTGFASYRLLF